MNFKINSDFTGFKKVFLAQNAVLNLISKNEEKFLWEKHIYDSLSIKLFFEKYSPKKTTLLDIGTGGGFPAVPIAIECPDINVCALDSIKKKINAIENIKQELSINNLTTICDRAENIKDKKFDIITSRAVATVDKLVKYVSPLLKKEGYFVAYKSRLADKELEDAKILMKKSGLKLIDIIEYTLPLDEVYERKLVILQKVI